LTENAGDQRRRPRAGRRELRQFGLVMAAAAAIVAALLWYRGATDGAQAAAVIATLFLVLGLAAPSALTPFRWVWMRLACALGWVNTHLLLGLIFYALFTPIGCVMRWAGRAPLCRDLDPARSSYWQSRKQSQTPREQFERQF
jgi:saxitoxin biosynthesis operon SxtJ-like protein